MPRMRTNHGHVPSLYDLSIEGIALSVGRMAPEELHCIPDDIKLAILLKIKNRRVIHGQMFTALYSCNMSLCFLDLKHCQNIRDADITNPELHLPPLQKIDCSYCGHLSDAALAALLGRDQPELRELTLDNLFSITGGWAACAPQFHQLQRLSVQRCSELLPHAIAQVAAGCPHLQVLRLAECYQMTDEALSKPMPKLQVLDISGCTRISAEGLLYALDASLSLHELNVSCCGISGDWLMYALARRKATSSLRTLAISYLEEITDVGIAALCVSGHLGALEVLHIEALEELSMDAFIAIQHNTPQLMRLFCDGCHGLTEEGAFDLVNDHPALESIALKNCGLSTMTHLRLMASFEQKKRRQQSGCDNRPDLAPIPHGDSSDAEDLAEGLPTGVTREQGQQLTTECLPVAFVESSIHEASAAENSVPSSENSVSGLDAAIAELESGQCTDTAAISCEETPECSVEIERSFGTTTTLKMVVWLPSVTRGAQVSLDLVDGRTIELSVPGKYFLKQTLPVWVDEAEDATTCKFNKAAHRLTIQMVAKS